tara:strand:- start:30 stop:422 length:393 start_codon:yes stop_codon:yes gene_type:complete
VRKRRPEGLKFSHPPQPFSIPIFAVWGAFFPPRFVELRHLAQRRRDAKAGTGLARPDLNKLQLDCQQRLTNAEIERWASSPFISLISGMKIACVFIAKKGRHEFSWGKTHGSNPYISLEDMSQTGFLSAE